MNTEPISKSNIEKTDYTYWQQEYFDKFSPEELNEKVADFAKNYIFKGNPDSVLKLFLTNKFITSLTF
jgi:hypothetical protein